MPSKNVYDEYIVAGQEVSSTYEGRHIQLEESILVHPTHSDGFVDKGDPVIATGDIVGVAFNSAAAATDYIAIDTEGIWALSVVGKDDEGNVAIAIGDTIYINRTTAELSRISSDDTHSIFGYALNEVNSGATTVIAVKVHWGWWYDVYRDVAAGGAAQDALLIDVDDASTLATGYQQCLQTTMNASGDKTGSAEIHNIAADMALSGDVPYAYNYTSYISASGNPAIDLVSGFSCYLDEMGTGVVSRDCLDLGKVTTNKASGRETFQRMREHGTGGSNISNSVFLLESQNNSGIATYLVDFNNGGGVCTPFIVAAVGGNQTAKIAVRLNGTPYYIPLYTA